MGAAGCGDDRPDSAQACAMSRIRVWRFSRRVTRPRPKVVQDAPLVATFIVGRAGIDISHAVTKGNRTDPLAHDISGPKSAFSDVRPMTPRQLRFVDEYLVDLNATQAAMRAGYSGRTANEQGARLLANASTSIP